MKRIISKNSVRQSVLTATVISVLMLALFAFFAGSTIPGTSQQKFKLPDGRWELARNLSGGKSEIIRGNVDSYGRFEGPAEIIYERDFERTSTEQVNMKGGNRHGTSKVTFNNGRVEFWCYEHGKVLKKGKCDEKSYSVLTEENSAFGIFSFDYQWFAFKLDAFGFDSSYMKSYLDTLELLISARVSVADDFEDYYDEAISELEETPYDSIISFNAELSLYNGSDMILNHEFRLATLDSYMEGDSNTYNVVTSIYPNYLLKLNANGVSDADFERFCGEYDAIMQNYGPISPEDPYLLDSLDNRMYRAMDSIYSSEGDLKKQLRSLQSSGLTNKIRYARNLQIEKMSQLLRNPMESTPGQVAELIISDILGTFLNGDLIREAVREAYFIQNELTTLPTVITDFAARTSATSVTLEGNILKDGGGEIIARGIAWGSIYKPTIENQFSSAGTGTGEFAVDLTGLTEEETYYARAFATNSAGTAYGNCIEFVAGVASGIELTDADAYQILIYPNPASDHITLNFQSEEQDELIFTMYDLKGKVVLRKELSGIVQGENDIHIPLFEIQNGVYFCRIDGGNKTFTPKKILISR